VEKKQKYLTSTIFIGRVVLDLGNRNISQAQYLLGELYLEGRGFVKDEKKALNGLAKLHNITMEQLRNFT
jgi:TPR repeat protein